MSLPATTRGPSVEKQVGLAHVGSILPPPAPGTIKEIQVNGFKRAAALSLVGGLMSTAAMFAAAPADAQASPSWPRFEQWAPCHPVVHVTNFNNKPMKLRFDGLKGVYRLAARTAGNVDATGLDVLRWTATVGGKKAGHGKFRVNADCPSA